MNRKLKTELIDVRAELEQVKASEAGLKTVKEEINNKLNDCTNSLRSSKLRAESIGLEKTNFEESIKQKDSLIEELKKTAADATNLKNLLTAQETISNQLNQTNILLQNEIAALKTTQKRAEDPAAQGQNVAGNGAQAAPVQEEKPTLKPIGLADIIPKVEDKVELPVPVEQAPTTTSSTSEATSSRKPDLLQNNEENAKDTGDEKKIDDAVDNPEADVVVPKPDVFGDEKEPKVKGGDYNDDQGGEKDDTR